MIKKFIFIPALVFFMSSPSHGSLPPLRTCPQICDKGFGRALGQMLNITDGKNLSQYTRSDIDLCFSFKCIPHEAEAFHCALLSHTNHQHKDVLVLIFKQRMNGSPHKFLKSTYISCKEHLDRLIEYYKGSKEGLSRLQKKRQNLKKNVSYILKNSHDRI